MFSRALPLRRFTAQRVLAIARTYTSRRDPAGNSSIGTTQPPRPGYGDPQKSKPLNPHLPNPPSTNDPRQRVPRVGIANAPSELVSAAGTDFTPENSEDIQRVVGAGQDTGPGLGGSFGGEKELGVGEMAEAKFRIEPLRRQGEDPSTMRARLLYQSRKRGILETDLLLSTFADTHLPTMSLSQLQQYDLFLDENDWDIYYWTTQNPPPTSTEGGPPLVAAPTDPQPTSPETPTTSTPTVGKHADAAAAATSQGQSCPESQAPGQAAPQSEPHMQGASSGTNQPGLGEGPVGEWVQTVGRVKEPYRPPPSRWRDSEILEMLRAHVRRRKSGDGIAGSEQRGLGRMPDVRQF